VQSFLKAPQASTVRHVGPALVGVLMAGALVGCDQPAAPSAPLEAPAPSLDREAGGPSAPGTVTVYATGLNNPRGLRFGPDGLLYVAEGGVGGTNSTVGSCTQVPAPVGPYTGSPNGGRISRINRDGSRVTVVDNLPSSQTSPAQGNLISGVADVDFVDGHLYGLLAGAGCSHGVPSVPNGIIRVHGHQWTMVANLSAFQMAHPVAHPDLDDFEPDGTWYSMVAVGRDLYAAEPNHQEIVRVSPRSGAVHRVADVSADVPGWMGPTSLVHDGNFYFGTLTPFPTVEGAATVYKMTSNGRVSPYATGFTMIGGVAFDHERRMYVLETSTGNPFPTPGTGTIVRVDHSGHRETIASGLFLPTAMTFGPDGNLYVSNVGFGPPPLGLGTVVKVTVR
jgi:hypothetical protein